MPYLTHEQRQARRAGGSTDEDWRAYLREAELAYYAAADDMRALGSDDAAIIGPLPAARERCRMAKARYQERLTAFIAFTEWRHAVR